MQSTNRKSAAGIVVRRQARPTDRISRLRALIATCGPNKNDQAIVAITACIEEGINTGPSIISTLDRIGLNPRHAGMMLNNGTGDNAERHSWSRDGEGRYSLLS